LAGELQSAGRSLRACLVPGNELPIDHDQGGDLEIVVYNRAILGTVLDIDAGDGA